jgi:hypothetical protein
MLFVNLVLRKKRRSNMPRDYKKEYNNYHGKPDQIKKRASRVQARRDMEKTGKVRKGDGKDVDHKNGNPKDNRPSNLRVQSKSQNRSFPRDRNAKKR